MVSIVITMTTVIEATKKIYKTNMLESFKKSVEVANAEDDMKNASRRRKSNYEVGDYDRTHKASVEFQDAARRKKTAESEAKAANDAANKALKKYEAMKVTEFVAKNMVKGLNAISSLIYKLTHRKKSNQVLKVKIIGGS